MFESTNPRGQVGINRQSVIGVSRAYKRPLSQTEQIVFAQQAQNAFMVGVHAAPVQFFGDRPVAVRAHLQSDALNLPAQFDIVAERRTRAGRMQMAKDSRARETNRLAERSNRSLGSRSLSCFLLQ